MGALSSCSCEERSLEETDRAPCLQGPGGGSLSTSLSAHQGKGRGVSVLLLAYH